MTKAKNEEANYSHFEQFADDVEGYDGINMDTMAIPFIRIIQALSPQLKKSKPEFIAGAEEGNICNSITGKLYSLPLKVVVGKFERLFIEWKPKRGGFVAAHMPESIEGNPRYVTNEDYKLIDSQTQNEMVDTYMYYILLPDYVEDGICIMAMSSTQLKEAKKLNRMLMTTYIPGTTKKALPHFMVFNFDTLEMSNDKGDWFTPNFTFDSFVTQGLLENVVDERKALPNKKIDLAQLDETAGRVDQSQPVRDEDVKY